MKKNEKRGRLRKLLYPAGIAALVVFCGYILFPGFRDLETVRSKIAELERIHREKELRNDTLREEIAKMRAPEGIERAARRHLRLVRPDEVIVVFRPEEGKEYAEQ